MQSSQKNLMIPTSTQEQSNLFQPMTIHRMCIDIKGLINVLPRASSYGRNDVASQLPRMPMYNTCDGTLFRRRGLLKLAMMPRAPFLQENSMNNVHVRNCNMPCISTNAVQCRILPLIGCLGSSNIINIDSIHTNCKNDNTNTMSQNLNLLDHFASNGCNLQNREIIGNKAEMQTSLQNLQQRLRANYSCSTSLLSDNIANSCNAIKNVNLNIPDPNNGNIWHVLKSSAIVTNDMNINNNCNVAKMPSNEATTNYMQSNSSNINDKDMESVSVVSNIPTVAISNAYANSRMNNTNIDVVKERKYHFAVSTINDACVSNKQTKSTNLGKTKEKKDCFAIGTERSNWEKIGKSYNEMNETQQKISSLERNDAYIDNISEEYCSQLQNGWYKCERCFKKFKLLRSYKLHVQTHFGIGFKCNFCSKIFARRPNLIEHVRIQYVKKNVHKVSS